ncbi:UbiA family prenyltransferase [Acidocella sp.]|uniref:UbiA family prenyltransferase n=1 Tax=Acidocella sp. TaxID=50710 RepID=UPI002616B838|nr:UbiA family prenyltransferase [Acidocella sp.]
MNPFAAATAGGDASLAKADEAVICALLDAAPTLVLAGAIDGNPAATPLRFARQGLELFMFVHRGSRMAAQLALNPQAQAVIWDEARGMGLEIAGRGTLLRPGPARDAARALLAARFAPPGDDAALACLHLRPTRLGLVDATGAARHWAWHEFPGNQPAPPVQAMQALGRWLHLWVRAARAPFFTAAIVPVLLGAAVAFRALAQAGLGARFSWPVFLWALLGAVLAAAGTNLANDYGDHESGCDDANQAATPFSGGSRAIQLGLLAPWKVLAGAGVCFGATIGIGLHINAMLAGSAFAPTPLLATGIIGVALGVTYTAGPVRLSYAGLGELAVALGFGPVIVLGTAYVLAAKAGVACAWGDGLLASLPVALFIMLVLWINQFQDAPADAASAKRNWVVRLSGRGDGQFSFGRAFAVYQGLNISGFALIALLGVLVTPWALLGLVALPLHVRAARQGRAWVAAWDSAPPAARAQLPFALLPVNAATIFVHLTTGLALALGVMLSALV